MARKKRKAIEGGEAEGKSGGEVGKERAREGGEVGREREWEQNVEQFTVVQRTRQCD